MIAWQETENGWELPTPFESRNEFTITEESGIFRCRVFFVIEDWFDEKVWYEPTLEAAKDAIVKRLDLDPADVC